MSRVVAISPPNDAAVSRSQLRLIWGRDAEAVRYHVVIADSTGVVLWSGSVTDTVLAPPDTTRLPAGARYFWRVDVLHRDGTSAQTGETAFRVAP